VKHQPQSEFQRKKPLNELTFASWREFDLK